MISDPTLGSGALGFAICDLLADTLGFDFGIWDLGFAKVSLRFGFGSPLGSCSELWDLGFR